MRFSEQWLRSWVNPPLSSAELVEVLTMAGLEVDTIEPVEAGDDHCIEIDLTPNRGDCLSIQGLARELRALTEAPIAAPQIPVVPALISTEFPIQILATEACPHYVGRVIEAVNAKASTPDWMMDRLMKSGLNSISIIVDILNYVMLELGQPLHAFDCKKLKSKVEVRFANKGEQIILLDEQTVQLKQNTLIIADDTGPQAIAGIMGGLESGVSVETTTVFIESALFSQKQMAGQARLYGLVTDASSRFERGVDPHLQVIAVERATALILELCGGNPGPTIEKRAKEATPHVQINLRYPQVKRTLGLSFSEKEIENFLVRLNCEFSKQDQVWKVFPPTYRYDLREEIDLIEECSRLYGYNRIPELKPHGIVMNPKGSESEISVARYKRLLMDAGFHEAITYSFVNPKIQAFFKMYGDGLALQNPISQDMSVMRTSLWPGLVSALQHNLARQQTRVKLFEAGLIFKTDKPELQQIQSIGGVAVGSVYPESWGTVSRPIDFFDIKGTVESLWALTQQYALTFKPETIEALHPGQSAGIYAHGRRVGLIGALHPEIEKALDLPTGVFLFELELSALRVGKLPTFEKISKFPLIRRDIAIVVDAALPAREILELVEKTAGELVREVKLFDVYQGKGIPEGKKSLAMALILQENSRTLVDTEVEKLLKDVVSTLQKHFAAELRE